MTDPLARVVIVNYNGGRYLAEAVQSVRSQTVPCELVVVDNCSTDSSLQTIAFLDDVTVLRSPRNIGFGAGANYGFRGARTPFLATLNPDAVASPDWLQRMLPWMERERVDLGACLIGAGENLYFTGGSWNRLRGRRDLARYAQNPRTGLDQRLRPRRSSPDVRGFSGLRRALLSLL